MLERFAQFCASIASIQRSILRIERVEMAKYGLKVPHASCLVAIARYPEGITAARLCEICDKDKAAISRTLSELENAGMILRNAPEGKRYRALLRLSEKGKEIAYSVNEKILLAVAKASEGSDKEKQQIFARVLGLVAGNLQDICREGLESRETVTKGE